MARTANEITPARAPRGTKPVMQAFFAALDAVPVSLRQAVAKAAQVKIRDELRNRSDKLKAVAAKEKSRHPMPVKRAAKPVAPKMVEPAPEVSAKRRIRKQDVPAAA